MNVNLEDVIDKIINNTNKSKKEILKRIEAKKEDLGGLITDEGAACIVAKELGVEVFEPTTYKRKRPQIEELIIGMNGISILGRVVAIFGVRELTRRKKQESTEKTSENKVMCGKFLLQDPTGQITVNLWGTQTNLISDSKISENSIIEIKNCYTKPGFNNKLELNLGKQGIIESNPSDVDLTELQKMGSSALTKINQLQEAQSVNVIGKVQWKSNINTFIKKTGSGEGRVANLTIFDKTGQVRVVLWADQASFVEQVETNDIIQVINGFTRLGRDGDIEIHLGDDSKIRKETKITIDLPDASAAPAATSSRNIIEVKIKELTKHQKNLKLVGKIVEKLEPREVSFKDGSRHSVCDVVIADETGSISLSIWDEDIEKVQKNETYCIENGYVSVFRGSPKLNVGKYGTMNPSEKKLTKVNKNNNLSNTTLEAERKHISDLKEYDNVDLLGTIVSIPEKNPIYKSCPKCAKKVSPSGESWECERCGKIPKYIPRMIWSLTLDDGTENIRVTVGGEVAEKLLGMTAAEAEKMIEDELIEQYPIILKSKELLGRKIIAKGNIRLNKYSDSLELSAKSILPPNPREELTTILARVESSI